MVIAPNGKIGFIEVKAPGKEPTKRQIFIIKLLEKFNVPVIWTDDPEIAEVFINTLLEGLILLLSITKSLLEFTFS